MRVKADQLQSEVGTLEIELNKHGSQSSLFEGLPDKFFVVMGHKDTVMEIPQGATLLASSEKCNVQALRFGKNVYTTQFHPELSSKIYFTA